MTGRPKKGSEEYEAAQRLKRRVRRLASQDPPVNNTEIARRCGVTRQRVQQILKGR